MKKLSLKLGTLLASVCVTAVASAGVILQEGFDDVAGLAGAGWVTTNASAPVGATSWFQGNVAPFPAQSGAPNSYAAANYLSTSPAGGTISTWLMTPTLSLYDGLVVSFWTRTDEDIDQFFSDRLNLRLSTAGASTATASFSTLLLSVNPALVPGTGYPAEWTQFSVTLSGLAVATTGRIGFEYSVPVTDDAQNPVFANYIGLDNVSIVPLPANAWLTLLGLLAMTIALRTRLAPRKLK